MTQADNTEQSVLGRSLERVPEESTAQQQRPFPAPVRHKTTQEPPVVLSASLDAWLLDCIPAPGCKVCAANWKQLNAAKDLGDTRQAARHATEIRDHASGVH